MAKTGKRERRKEQRIVPHAVAHIRTTFNNTQITISDPDGNVLAWSSAGRSGFKGQQAKAVHCLARLHDYGTGLMTYATDYDDSFPPALWLHADPDDAAYVHRFGWSEILWSYVYKEEIRQRDNFPVQRNVEGRQWAKYLLWADRRRSARACPGSQIQCRGTGSTALRASRPYARPQARCRPRHP